MEIVLHALNGVLTIMLMIAVGFYLERRDMLKLPQNIGQRGKCGADFASGELCLPAYIYADQYFGAV